MIKLIATFCVLALFTLCNADIQANKLYELQKLKKSRKKQVPDTWSVLDNAIDAYSPVYVGAQEGLAQHDKIKTLPGQPEGVDFDQYSGYVTVNPNDGRALFYYFVESPNNSSSKPLVLWLNGGPGCSSLIGAFSEVGPFRINNDGKTLFRNDYAWSKVANMLFLESPAGVGFSYSNTTSDYDHPGDKNTANDAYIFLVNWFERFPQYKTRDFYLTGESYAGHYIPQLAYTILIKNKNINPAIIINIKGIAIGNPSIDDETGHKGMYDYWWTHGINSDATHDAIFKYCNFVNDSSTGMCNDSTTRAWAEMGDIDIYNIYEPICLNPDERNTSGSGSINDVDPCWQHTLGSYLNESAVQKALHVKNTSWELCRDYITNWNDSAVTILPIIKYLIANDQRVWVFSGDVDARVPVTASRYSVNTLNLTVETSWQPWYIHKEVGGYLESYKGLLLISVRGAGHTVALYQPRRAFVVFSSFLKGSHPLSRL